ncbi:hypothetical protein PSTT_06883 [Puccinia striiformis]|uniref:Uncharacterized protein n=1 Tax=Puccinia striiformis TaxID=27350 RepID=A0A2S4VID1_9BASI|nr:hypothetical protein PSTT_06883 [Puccinia striiformis]
MKPSEGSGEARLSSNEQPSEVSSTQSSSNASSQSEAAQEYLKLRTVAISLIDQAINLLENVVNSDTLLTTVSHLVPGSTIGKHLRHLHDHFRILFEAVNSHTTTNQDGLLNYDSRERNVPMESSHHIILQEFIKLKLNYLANPLSRLNQLDQWTELWRMAVDEDRIDLRSKYISVRFLLYRDQTDTYLIAGKLWFVCLHATHHYALIRVIVTGELKLELPKQFGVAPSTLERSKM